MEYSIVALILIVVMLGYFRVADHFNIIDKPNERSSHTGITLRGGGVIFYVGILLWFIQSGGEYPWFFAGLSAIALVSFIDDVFTLSNRVRLSVHLVAVLLLLYQLGLFSFPWYMGLVAIILIVGTINAYNFMDGINGITAAYSFSVLGLLWIANNRYDFIEGEYLQYVALANLVFAFFNFRNKAKCFAGDVGSVSMSFIVIFALSSLIVKTGNFVYIMFLSVYGIDTVLTIVHRIFRKENIFRAHRLHLFQYLANEAGGNRLLIASGYGILQFGIGLLILQSENPWTTSILILLVLVVFYVITKYNIHKKYVLVK
jgi:UDP-GlcNAc:undecaprenyl-phosphate GlcNAc-1-phosphate transferase